jgi:hypothetical protein
MAETHGRLLWLLPLLTAAIGFAAGRFATVEPVSHTVDAHPQLVAQGTFRKARPKRPSAAPSRAAAPLPPMPATDLPLAETFDALAARARGGDANASLRLLRELGHCVAQGGQGNVPDVSPNDIQLLQAEITRGELAAAEASCPNVTIDQLASVGEWLQRAADSGDPGAALCYVVMGTSDRYLPDRYSDAWVEAMQRYRASAPMYAERALAAGYPLASVFLYDAASGIYSTNLFQVDRDIAPNFEHAYALARFREGVAAAHAEAADPGEATSWPAREAALRAELDDAEIARADRWASAELARMPADEPPAPPCDLPFR